jgi:APA family basic amino acid/polyamine antiporter
VLACLFLMLNLTGETWLRFLVWMLAGFVVYFVYGARHSRLAVGGDRAPTAESAPPRTE